MSNALIEAIKDGANLSLKNIQDFLQTGIDINQEDDETGGTALTLAAQNNLEETFLNLLQIANININAQDNEFYTALMIAASQERLAMVEALLKRDEINLFSKNLYDETALTLSDNCENQTIRELLYSKITVAATLEMFALIDDNYSSQHDLAVAFESLVTDHRADPDAILNDTTALILAIRANQAILAATILRHSKNILAKDYQGKSVANFAYENRDYELFNQVIAASLKYQDDRNTYAETWDHINESGFEAKYFSAENLAHLLVSPPYPFADSFEIEQDRRLEEETKIEFFQQLQNQDQKRQELDFYHLEKNLESETNEKGVDLKTVFSPLYSVKTKVSEISKPVAQKLSTAEVTAAR